MKQASKLKNKDGFLTGKLQALCCSSFFSILLQPVANILEKKHTDIGVTGLKQ